MSNTTKVGPALIEKVMAEIEKEADLEGVCNASARYIADILKIHRDSVSVAIQELIKAGRVRDIGRVRHKILLLEIVDY